MTQRKYTPELRAQVMAQLLSGQSIGSLAKQHNLPKATLSLCKNKIFSENAPAMIGTVKERIGEMLLEYLYTSLIAMKQQCAMFSDPEWIKAQDAKDIGVLHGILSDKVMRLIEALAKKQEPSQ